MSFTCMHRAEYVKWKEDKPPIMEIDTNQWIMELVDAVRKGMVDEYLHESLKDDVLVFSKAEHLWGKEVSQHFFNRLHDVREKQGLQTVLVTDLNEKQAAIFRYYMNISCALYKLLDYHFQIPEIIIQIDIRDTISFAFRNKLAPISRLFFIVSSLCHPFEYPSNLGYSLSYILFLLWLYPIFITGSLFI